MKKKEIKKMKIPLSEETLAKLAELYGTTMSEVKKILAGE